MLNIEKSPEVQLIVDFVKELKPRSTLEIGMNYGRELKHLVGLTELYGIDKDPVKIEKAKSYCSGSFRVGDASALPYESAKFELCYSSGVFLRTPPEDAKQILDELYRVSSKYILLVEYIGSRLSKNVVGNCKVNTWVHDYEMLIAPLNVNIMYKEKKFFGADCFQVILMQKQVAKAERSFTERVKNTLSNFKVFSNYSELEAKVKSYEEQLGATRRSLTDLQKQLSELKVLQGTSIESLDACNIRIALVETKVDAAAVKSAERLQSFKVALARQIESITLEDE
jgi:ubiquinone/menaquinone biosynthesis C-methylase UbiE